MKYHFMVLGSETRQIYLAELLQEEAGEAFENRRALAKKMGEECESKLLFPMLLMLLTILIIIMYPAVIPFQG